MNEQEAEIELMNLYEFYKPKQTREAFVNSHKQKIRMMGKGYWINPEATQYIKELKSELYSK